MTRTTQREIGFLERAGLVVLVLQLAIFVKMWIDLGLDRASDNYPILVLSTALFVASQRRLAARPPNRGAAQWIMASRAAALALFALGAAAVGFYRLVPDAAPAPQSLVHGLFALLWTIIALKGAGVGKLKPGGPVGLCVRWTLQSRLAWDRAHRVLGRVLFFGGLVGLASSLVVPLPVSLAMWTATVAVAVGSALIESWRTWRLDPDRRRLV